jgi:hypothetical protein
MGENDCAIKCDRCLSRKQPPAPMLQDATWQKLAKKHETLCAKCAFARARKRGLELTFEDLLPCASNLEGPWFVQFLSAEPRERAVSSELAYAWQWAMIIKSKQMQRGPAAQDFPPRKVLAVDRRTGLTLREAPEGGLYWSDEIDWAKGHKYLKVELDGDLKVEIFICFEGNNARLREIIAPQGPNSLGTSKTRSIFRLLQQAYPSLETLNGFRSTGVRSTRPEELKFSLNLIAGISSATAQAA